MSNKKPGDLLYLHDLFQSAWDTLKEKPKKEEYGPAEMEKHADDFSHPKNIFLATRNFPIPANNRVVQTEAEKMLKLNRIEEAAKMFFLSQANTFQHLVLMQQYKKASAATVDATVTIANREIDTTYISDHDCESFEEKKGRLLLFKSFQETQVMSQLKVFPKSWTIVQISVSHQDPVLTRFKKSKKELPLESNPSLVLLRAQGGEVIISTCSGPDSTGCTPIFKEFADIHAENLHVMRNERDLNKYWSLRKNLDHRLEALLRSVESRWLGYEKSLFLGQFQEQHDLDLVDKVIQDNCKESLTSQQRMRLKVLLSATPFLSTAEMKGGLGAIFPSSDKVVANISSAARSSLGNLKNALRHPVIFIMDPHIKNLPWESLPCLSTCKQAASRVPSLPFLHTLWQSHCTDKASVVTTGVASDNIFYVVNPEGNLPNTQRRLDKAFQDYQQWEGITGKEPNKEQLQQVLQNKDAYMFCGHGSGTKFLSGDEIERLRVHAVPLLMGCGSGQLLRHGRSLDPLGTAQSYMLASSPALLGFLWAVTDADVDQWTVIFLQHWLGGKKDGQPELLQAAADKRSSFKQALNAAALVVYGLPLKSRI